MNKVSRVKDVDERYKVLCKYYKCHCQVDYNSIILCSKHFALAKKGIASDKGFTIQVGE